MRIRCDKFVANDEQRTVRGLRWLPAVWESAFKPRLMCPRKPGSDSKSRLDRPRKPGSAFKPRLMCPRSLGSAFKSPLMCPRKPGSDFKSRLNRPRSRRCWVAANCLGRRQPTSRASCRAGRHAPASLSVQAGEQAPQIPVECLYLRLQLLQEIVVFDRADDRFLLRLVPERDRAEIVFIVLFP